ncbi:GNAT family N-acetyltransferase [Rheinheimera fenheensis]|uniref:GNAT family N-acetyltransferase n=1 Tax=Rheinheimera fenheensis TaxID=3152295 RepID=UPI00325ECE3E
MSQVLKPQLALASVAEMCQLRRWFNNADEQHSWGGDNFAYPCSELRFLQQLCRPGTQSYALIGSDQQDSSTELLGFGQLCDRFGCHHLARLVIRPDQRGQGLAKVLIYELIIQALGQQQRNISLYVHRHNTIAVSCYQQLGFVISPPPEVENSRLYFMTLTVAAAIKGAEQYLQQA